MASPSRSTYRGASSQGNASRSRCMVHSCVACSVTPKCTTRRRLCDSTTKTNRTRKVTRGTVKQSTARSDPRASPSGPGWVRQHRRGPVAAVGAQAAWRVLLENRKLVTKGEDLRLQRCTGPKTGGYQSEKGDEKRAHYGSHHDLSNDRNPCVFRSDGVSGNHSCLKRRASSTLPLLTAGGVIACLRVRSYGRKPLGGVQLDLDLPPARVARLVAWGVPPNI